jgi:hypothetical protein
MRQTQDGIIFGDRQYEVDTIETGIERFLRGHREDIAGYQRGVALNLSLEAAGMDPQPIPELDAAVITASSIRHRIAAHPGELPVSLGEAPVVRDIMEAQAARLRRERALYARPKRTFSRSGSGMASLRSPDMKYYDNLTSRPVNIVRGINRVLGDKNGR